MAPSRGAHTIPIHLLDPEADEVLGPEDWRGLARLVRRATATSTADFGALDALVLEGLSAVVGGHKIFWLLARRQGDAPDTSIWAIRDWHALGRGRAEMNRMDNLIRSGRFRDLPEVRASLEHAGRPRASLESPEDSQVDRRTRALLDAIEVGSRLVVVHQLAPELELHVCVDREAGDAPFDLRHARTLHLACELVAGHLRGLALSRGLLPHGRVLSPRERETTQLLLRGLSEKEVAAELGVTARSAHQLVTAIYRKLGVRSRPELMALWLRASSR